MNPAHAIHSWSKAAFLLLSSAALFIFGLYFYNIVKWSGYPDFGYRFRTATGASIIGQLTENGRNSGLEIGDRFLAVNGNTFDNILEFRSAMNRVKGEQNTYLLERNDQQVQVVVPNTPIGLKKSFFQSGFLFLLGLCVFSIGIVIFCMKPHARDSWVFLLFTVVTGLFITFLYKVSKMTPSWLETVHIFVYTFAPATFIHMALSFPQERRFVRLHPLAQWTPYFFSAFLFIYVRSGTTNITDSSKNMLIAILVYLALSILFFLVSCLQLWLTSDSEIVKLRAKMVFLGFGMAALVPLIDFISSVLFGVYLLPHENVKIPFLILFPAFIGYSIVKHDLFEIDTIIKRTYGYILTTGVIAGAYGVFTLVSDLALGRFAITESPLFPLIFVLIVVFLFNPIRNRSQKFIDRVFYRLEYDYQETVHRISETMRSLLKLDEVGQKIIDIALGTLFVDAGCVMLLNPTNATYECLSSGGERELKSNKAEAQRASLSRKDTGVRNSSTTDKEILPDIVSESSAGKTRDTELLKYRLTADEPLIQKISERKKEVNIYDIHADPLFQNQQAECSEAFDRLEATLIVPLIYEDKLTGLISLGGKKSGKFFRREDINLLNTLANQGAVAIENAKMIEEVIEKERMEEELSIARDLQTSMLPARCPTIEGFELAAFSLSAREIGGDFYDFIDMGENKVGMVIGDVTGKSVSGALVMSASRSIFRMLSEENVSVGEIMVRANRRTKQDIKPGMFVALLYAVINAKDRTLSLCSAGQTQPVYWSSEAKTPSLVETKGDKFPLGILEDADYEETRLHLKPGDKIVLYTDGIVEAMNGKGEIFGFERLLKTIQGAFFMSADHLLKEILDSVYTFADKAAQHDDLTVIVVSAVE